MITITKNAGSKVVALLAQEDKAKYGLRVFVTGGGCSGFQYGMEFEETETEEDTVIEAHGVKLFVDPYSQPLLMGTQIDYNDGLQESGFTIKNPNAKSTCGCGKSFST